MFDYKNVKLISISQNLPGPLACKKLSELGVNIIKIEPKTGDPMKLASKDYYEYLSEKSFIILEYFYGFYLN